MSQELFYTSAPRGLKPGSHGYCTVAATSGMAPNVADKLESLSAYRHIFAPGERQAASSPVVYSYLRIIAGGRTYFVLSRIADAGLDYTQRTNKFAHHIALDATELPAAGPAWLLSFDGFMATRWDGEPRILAAGRKAPKGNLSLRICRAWEAIAGDAGWAGVLADSVARPAPTFLIVQPEMDILPLMVEAQSLLSPKQRWAATFSTYFTKLPPEVECQWRCVLHGSPEAKSARSIPGALVIDLTQPLGAADDSLLTTVARTGVPPPLSNASARETAAADTQQRKQPLPLHQIEVTHDEYGVGGDLRRHLPPTTMSCRGYSRKTNRKSRQRLLLTIASFAVLLGVTLGGVIIVLRSPPRTTSKLNAGSSIVERAPPRLADRTTPTTAPTNNPVHDSPSTVVVSPTESVEAAADKSPADQPAPRTAPTTASSPSLDPSPSKVEPSLTKPSHSPINSEPLVLAVGDMPTSSQQLTGDTKAVSAPLSISDPDIKLLILNPPKATAGFTLAVEPSQEADTWQLKKTYSAGRRAVPGTAIGNFRRTDGDISFDWTANRGSEDPTDLLRDSVLIVSSLKDGSEQAIVFRDSAIQKNPFILKATAAESSWDLPGVQTSQELYVELSAPLQPVLGIAAHPDRVYAVTPSCKLHVGHSAGRLHVELRYNNQPTCTDALYTKYNKLLQARDDCDRTLANLEAEAPRQICEGEDARQEERKRTQKERDDLQAKVKDLERVDNALRVFAPPAEVPFRVLFNVDKHAVEVASGRLAIEPSKLHK